MNLQRGAKQSITGVDLQSESFPLTDTYIRITPPSSDPPSRRVACFPGNARRSKIPRYPPITERVGDANAPTPAGEPEQIPGKIACSMVSMLLRQVRTSFGQEGVAEVVRRSGVPYEAPYLEDIGNWIWYEEAIALFDAGVELTGDESIGLHAGEESLRQHAGTPVATLLRQLGTPEAILQQTALVATKFSTITEMRADARRARPRDRHRLRASGLRVAPPVLRLPGRAPVADHRAVRPPARARRGDRAAACAVTTTASTRSPGTPTTPPRPPSPSS